MCELTAGMTGRILSHHKAERDVSARARLVRVGKRSVTVELLEPFY
jgi:hypothetical protein